MRILIASRLSEHRYKTPEGYLVCVDSVLSRTGKQTYRRRELYGDACDNPEDVVEVDRPADEVFSDKALASFENKPITEEHPDEDVTINNHDHYSVGFVRDIKRGKDGDNDVMLGTLVVTNPDAVAKIESGELTELSCGYDCDITGDENPVQCNIRGNHVALCEHGRAGIARIVDSVKDDDTERLWQVVAYWRSDIAGIVKRTQATFFVNAGTKQEAIDKVKKAYNYDYVGFDVTQELVPARAVNAAKFSGKYIDSKTEDADVAEKQYIVGYVNDSDKAEYVTVKAKTADEAKAKVKKLYKPYRIFECREQNKKDSVKDGNHLPGKVKKDIQMFFNHRSTFIKNRDYDVSEFVKEFERITKLWVEFPLKLTREKIVGWNKMSDGMMRKDYYFSIDGYEDRFMLSLYAKPDTYETTELNVFFTDSAYHANDSYSNSAGNKLTIISVKDAIVEYELGSQTNIISESNFTKMLSKYGYTKDDIPDNIMNVVKLVRRIKK